MSRGRVTATARLQPSIHWLVIIEAAGAEPGSVGRSMRSFAAKNSSLAHNAWAPSDSSARLIIPTGISAFIARVVGVAGGTD
jgi:hypothetical protein